MYDKALEQLIDAVIADGVITDQERKVVYKKAASLGIDQDEIEVYLNGRLDSFNKANPPKSNKNGSIKTCPNCGATVDSFAGKCSECGYNFSDLEANLTTRRLQTELERIDKEEKTSIAGSVLSAFGRDGKNQRKIQLIKNFAIPNTKADLIEFAMLCYTNLSVKATNSAELELRKSWGAKAKEIEAKANLLFPNDNDVRLAISHLSKERRNFFKANQKTITIISCLAVLLILIFGLSLLVSHSSDKEEKYTLEKVQEIENLPDPDSTNYKECFRKFSSIHWTESTHSTGYKTFTEAQTAYRDLLINAYKEAGISDDMIPGALKNIGQDIPQPSDENTQMESADDEGASTENTDVEPTVTTDMDFSNLNN